MSSKQGVFDLVSRVIIKNVNNRKITRDISSKTPNFFVPLQPFSKIVQLKKVNEERQNEESVPRE